MHHPTRYSHSTRHHVFNSPLDTNSSLSRSTRTSSTSFQPENSYSRAQLSTSRNSLLQFPNNSEYSSRITNSRNTNSVTNTSQQPQLDPHHRFLNRSVDNCPLHLTKSQRTTWLKTGAKAQKNHDLLNTYDLFHWSTSHYDHPIHIHHRTPSHILYSLIRTITDVHLFTIDTESDKTTKQQPQSTPALLQIQAIHNEELATVILIEVQHLPAQSTSLFHQIQQLCHLIFTPNNKIMAWGDVISELHRFEQFQLFNTSNIVDPVDIQQIFLQQWNEQHPHTTECVNNRYTLRDNDEFDDYLICLINSDDLDNDLHTSDSTSHYSTCICPDTVRPYKDTNATWSLQKAVQHTFHKALDKKLTLNVWSCGLDTALHTWNTYYDQHVRQSLVTYAINDLFAPTQLYFHYHPLNRSTQSSNNVPLLNTILSTGSTNLPSIFILSDSHGKHLESRINMTTYHIISRSISGLQWMNTHNKNVCANSIISTASVTSFLSCASKVLFLIGTNSTRNTSALQIIEQIEEIINKIRFNHSHLSAKDAITIIATFPCFKPSYHFPSIDLLMQNIGNYNGQLQLLSNRLNFSYVDFDIDPHHLRNDHLHLQDQYQPLLYTKLINYVDSLLLEKPTIPQSQRRSRTAVTRRNKKRHEKLKAKQKQHTLTRPIHPSWQLQAVKSFLKTNNIKFTRLPEIYKHQIRIQFNNDKDQHNADQILSSDVFNEHHYIQWCHNHR